MTDWGEAAFNPGSIALVGASAKSSKLGHILMRNLLEGYPGKLYPINPGETEIMGRQAYLRLLDVPGQVDLAVIALPTESCVEAMRDCASIGAKAALVLSGGFAEVGPDGQARQEALIEAARAGGVRIIGPNCFGLYNCNLGLNASMGLGLPPKGGSISLVTQSGAYGMAIFGLAQQRRLRFAKILSHGNKADLTDHEILNYFEQDDETRVLCLFLESVGDGRKFYEALVRVAQRKPVVIAKTGRSSAGRRAAASHTAALTGDETAFVTAVRQAGAILAESGLEMVDIAEALSRQPLPPGHRVAIITNSGGTGVELADMCERFGLSVPELPEETQARISPLIPAYASPRNPVDVTPAWARFPEMYAGSIEALYECNEVDIIIPILLQRSALMRENVEAVRDAVLRCQRERGLAKPTYVCWVVGREGDENQAILQEAGIPVYEWPERTARTAAAVAAYSENHRARTTEAARSAEGSDQGDRNDAPNRRQDKVADGRRDPIYRVPRAGGLSEGNDCPTPDAINLVGGQGEPRAPTSPNLTPIGDRKGVPLLSTQSITAAREQAASILAGVRAENRTSLLESEVKALLAAYGARIPHETLCASAEEALAAAEDLGKACVLKIVSPDISHKSDSGGVRVGVPPAEVGRVFEEMLAEVRTRQPTARILGVSVQELVHGQEVIIGGLRDAGFGAMLMFGLGGVFVETLRDVSYRLVPASTDELRAMIQEVRGYPLLTGIRGQAAADLEKLTGLLQVTAQLLEAFPEILELDLNPVFAGPEEAIVADGRAVLAER